MLSRRDISHSISPRYDRTDVLRADSATLRRIGCRRHAAETTPDASRRTARGVSHRSNRGSTEFLPSEDADASTVPPWALTESISRYRPARLRLPAYKRCAPRNRAFGHKTPSAASNCLCAARSFHILRENKTGNRRTLRETSRPQKAYPSHIWRCSAGFRPGTILSPGARRHRVPRDRFCLPLPRTKTNRARTGSARHRRRRTTCWNRERATPPLS